MQPHIDWTALAAIGEIAAAIVTLIGVLIMAKQVRDASKQAQEAILHSEEQAMKATIRSEWAILHAERQRLESDVTQCRIDRTSEVRGGRERQLSKRIEEVSVYMTRMLEDHPDVFPNLAYFTLKDEPNRDNKP